MADKPVEMRPPPDKLRAAIDKLVSEMKDRSIPNQRAATLLDQWVQDNFRTEGGRVGGWTPFKYGGRRMPGGGIDTNAKLLQDTGALRASYHSFYDEDQVGIGSDLFYAVFHEYGTGTLPIRRMLPQGGDDITMQFMRVYEDYFKELAEEFTL